MIAVIDTNIIASATFWRGKPAHCLEAWAEGKFEMAISQSFVQVSLLKTIVSFSNFG